MNMKLVFNTNAASFCAALELFHLASAQTLVVRIAVAGPVLFSAGSGMLRARSPLRNKFLKHGQASALSCWLLALASRMLGII
jgi:hypothetical protein